MLTVGPWKSRQVDRDAQHAVDARVPDLFDVPTDSAAQAQVSLAAARFRGEALGDATRHAIEVAKTSARDR